MPKWISIAKSGRLLMGQNEKKPTWSLWAQGWSGQIKAQWQKWFWKESRAPDSALVGFVIVLEL